MASRVTQKLGPKEISATYIDEAGESIGRCPAYQGRGDSKSIADFAAGTPGWTFNDSKSISIPECGIFQAPSFTCLFVDGRSLETWNSFHWF
jgi:hypothetical protein